MFSINLTRRDISSLKSLQSAVSSEIKLKFWRTRPFKYFFNGALKKLPLASLHPPLNYLRTRTHSSRHARYQNSYWFLMLWKQSPKHKTLICLKRLKILVLLISKQSHRIVLFHIFKEVHHHMNLLLWSFQPLSRRIWFS